MRAIRSEERKSKGDPIVGHKVDAIVALKKGDVRQARRSMQLARYLGASWDEIAWAFGNAGCTSEIQAHQWVKDFLAGRTS